MRHHKENHQCYRIDVVEELVQEVTAAETPSPLMDLVIINSVEQVKYEHYMKVVEYLLQLQATQVDHATIKVEEFSGHEQQGQPLVQKDHELKDFPKHLKYVFLGENPL